MFFNFSFLFFLFVQLLSCNICENKGYEKKKRKKVQYIETHPWLWGTWSIVILSVWLIIIINQTHIIIGKIRQLLWYVPILLSCFVIMFHNVFVNWSLVNLGIENLKSFCRIVKPFIKISKPDRSVDFMLNFLKKQMCYWIHWLF